MELLVRLHMEAKDDGELPDSADEVVTAVQDEVVIGTKSNENLPWRVVRVEAAGGLYHRVFASDGVSTTERTERTE